MASATEKTMACIRVLLDSPNGTSVLELAAKAGISRPAATRLVDSLLRDGLMVRDRTTKRLRMGLRLYEWTSRAVHRDYPLGVSEVEIIKLVEHLQRRVNLIVLEGCDAVYMDHYEWLDERAILTPVPSRAPWFLSAGGKAIVAFLDENIAAKVYQETAKAFPEFDLERTQTELCEARERGYAEAKGTLRPDIFGIAAPVLDHRGFAIASIGVHTTESELGEQSIQSIFLPLRTAARRVSQTLGYHPEQFAALA